MISEVCQGNLNVLMNHMKKVGTTFMAARRVFEAADDHGIACMMRAEAMERYEIGGSIGNHLIYRKGNALYSDVPAPAVITPNVAGMNVVVGVDSEVLSVLDQMISDAYERESYETAAFMQEIKFCCQKEYNEVRDIAREYGAMSADTMILFDKHLEKKYGHKYLDHNSC